MLTFKINCPKCEERLDRIATALETQNQLIAQQNTLLQTLLHRLLRPAQPGHLSCQLLKEVRVSEMSSILFRLTADAPSSSDVVKRKIALDVRSGDGESVRTEKEFAGDAVVFADEEGAESPFFAAPQDADVVVSLVDVDDAGNESPPATLEFKAVDQFPPAQAGGLGVTLVGERD